MQNIVLNSKNDALDLAIRNSPLTIKQICLCLDCDRVTLWRIVNNKSVNPKREIIIELCAILRSDPERFGFII